MTSAGSAAPESRQIRIFLSSTFRDFMEERDLLVKQVFPSLRRRAQERGVEVVDVDLRWGITEEESEQGKVIGICLAEIDRCRPYFIGMLGERYGWTPQARDYPAELLEQEQLGWIRDHQGSASVTELEILHGVLNDKEMAGRAFFYFRDPAWSRAQREPGFICDTPEEEAKLLALKERIRSSGFPVAEDLPDPKAIADQIEADLWALIEEQYPDLDQADALEREARKHASYRQSRLGVYLGQEYVDQLEALVVGGAQKILVGGESGSGKSALVANWIHQHELEHPGDVVFAHHLGCSNDASAIRPLLGRLLDTASGLLLNAAVINEPIEVPEDWWELTAKVAETLQDLGRWCRSTGQRWIWVLDGLDRLAEEDQQALPWLPLMIPEGVSVVISALECPARVIVEERQFRLLQIGALRREEQEQLIQRYLQRYTKQLDGGLRQQIVAHPQAGSPLFLRVLLEELRQCGRYERLAQQLTGYLQATSVAELYGLVLQRLEADGNEAACKAALTALWASRAGLPEAELLAISQLTPLQWAPIDLALQEALGRSGNRLVFGHDYLRQAVEMRYLPSEETRKAAHGAIADWFGAQEEWDARKAEELPWQLARAETFQNLIEILLSPDGIKSLLSIRPAAEAWGYWSEIEHRFGCQIEESYRTGWSLEASQDLEFNILLRGLLSHAGRHGDFALELSVHCVSILRGQADLTSELIDSLFELAELYRIRGEYQEGMSCCDEAIRLLHGDTTIRAPARSRFWMLYADICTSLARYDQAIKAVTAAAGFAYGPDRHFCTLSEGWIRFSLGDFNAAETLLREALSGLQSNMGESDSRTLQAMNNLGILLLNQSKIGEASAYTRRAWDLERLNLGPRHWVTALYALNYGWTLHAKGSLQEALQIYLSSLDVALAVFGDEHPMPNFIRCSLAWVEHSCFRRQNAFSMITEATRKMEVAIGKDHCDLAIFYDCLGWIGLANSSVAIAKDGFHRSVELSNGSGKQHHPDQIVPLCGLAAARLLDGDIEGSDGASTKALEIAQLYFCSDHLDLALALSTSAAVKYAQNDLDAALEKALHVALMRERILGAGHPDAVHSRSSIIRMRKGIKPAFEFTARRFSGGSFL